MSSTRRGRRRAGRSKDSKDERRGTKDEELNINRCVLRTSSLVPRPSALIIFALLSLAFSEESPLVDIQIINPHIQIDVRYATADNFMGEPLYPAARCLLRREVAKRLSRVEDALEHEGLGLKVFDAYRPLSVQKKLWARYPFEGYIANPAKGSNHNRGAAVDLTLVDIVTGKELPMPSAYDEFSERAHRDYAGGTAQERRNRALLGEAMAKEGFKGLATEWWHFDDADAKKYPVLDLSFDEVGAR
jgi:D-alanyl-D-alanine dipeptidase